VNHVSHRLYSRRVFWNGRTGGITIGGLYRNITSAPVFRDIEEIDYAPESGCMQLRPTGGKMREMKDVEIAIVEAYINAVSHGGSILTLKDLTPDAG
jgi:hypothetical protein